VTRPRVLLTVGFLILILAGCGQQIRGGQQESPKPEGTQVATGGGRVAVGGFSVEALGDTEATVPRVSVEREAAREYLNQVRPIVEGTARDVSDLVGPEVQVVNGQLEVDLGVGSLREAREDVSRGLERLREIRAPEELEPVHERLISAYEKVLPAYDNVIEPQRAATQTSSRTRYGRACHA
jgi:hypothetical protein